jgi:hypothetical protein
MPGELFLGLRFGKGIFSKRLSKLPPYPELLSFNQKIIKNGK